MKPWERAAQEQYTPEQQLDVIQGKEQLMPWDNARAALAMKGEIESQPAPIKEWSQVPSRAGETFLPSAGRFAEGMYHMVTSPQQTAANLTKLGQGAIEIMLDKIGLEDVVNFFGRHPSHQEFARNVGEFFANRYGSEEALMNTMANDPVGFMADAATVIYGGSAALSGLGKGAQVAGMERTGAAIDVAGAAGQKTAGYIDPLMLTGKAVSGGAKATGLLSAGLTGLAPDVLSTAYQSGKAGGAKGEAFRDAMRGDLDAGTIVTQAQDALKEMEKTAQANYRADKRLWANDPKYLDFDPVVYAIDEAIAKNRKFDKNSNTYIETNPKAVKALQEAKAEILKRADADPAVFHTVEGFDEMKQMLWGMVEKYSKSTSKEANAAKAALESVWSTVRKELGRQAPRYNASMKKFHDAQEQLNSIRLDLSLGGKNKDAMLRKLLSAMRNNVNTNFGLRKKYVKELEKAGAETLIPASAGMTAESWMPRGIQRATSPAIAVTQGLGGTAGDIATGAALTAGMSPRLSAEVAHGAGRVMGAPRRLPKPAYNLLELLGQPELINLLYQAQNQRERK